MLQMMVFSPFSIFVTTLVAMVPCHHVTHLHHVTSNIILEHGVPSSCGLTGDQILV